MRPTTPPLAKLTRPKLHGIVPRGRVSERLSGARERPMVWVSGPPGAGKTAALVSFLETSATHSIWFQVDAGDNDLSSFFYFLRLAAEPLRNPRAPALPLLTAEYLDDVPGYVRHFFRTLCAHLKAPSALVLDDYHELRADSPLHGLLEHAVNQLPEGINLIVSSRTGPPAQCARIVASEKLSRVDFDTLQLNLEEAKEIAARRCSKPAQSVEQLHRLCDGWPAGFTLMLHRLKRGDHCEGDPMQAGASTFDYFASQILQRCDKRLCDLLLQTALLPHMSAGMARALTRMEDAGTLLESLYRGRLFTEQRGADYRYHDLFRAFLLQRLEQERAPADVLELRRRAAALLRDAGQFDEAFELWRAAHDWSAAGGLILERAETLATQGRRSLLRNWIEALPGVVTESNPWFGFWLGVSLLEVDSGAARDNLGRSFEGMRASEYLEGRVLAASTYVLSYLNDLANLKDLDPWIAALTAMTDNQQRFASPMVEAQACAALMFALLHRRPERQRLEVLERRALAALDAELPSEVRLVTAQVLMMYYAQSSNIAGGNALVGWVTAHIDFDAVTPYRRSIYFFCSGHFHFFAGEVRRSNQEYQLSLNIAESNSISLPIARVFGLAGLAISHASFGDPDLAKSYADAALANLNRSHAQLHLTVAHGQFMIACRGRAWDAALDCAQLALTKSELGGWVQAEAMSHAATALVLAKLGRHSEAQFHSDEAKRLIEGTALYRWRGMYGLMDAQLALLRGDTDACKAFLRQGLAWMREDGSLLPLMTGTSRLLALAVDSGIEVEAVFKIIRRYEIRPPRTYDGHWPWPIEIRTLGAFELRRHGSAVRFEGKAPKRALQLLKALIAFGGGEVAQERLVDALWPDASGDEGINALNTTVSRLRKVLDNPDAIVQTGGCLSLNPDRCRVDALAFDALVGETMVEGSEATELGVDRALELYRGSFIPEEHDAPWAVKMRERLRRKFVVAIGRRGQQLEGQQEFAAAIRMYLRGIDADDLSEEFYQGLMRCYGRLGQRAEAMSIFRQLRTTLSVTLGLRPSSKSQSLFDALQREDATSV